MTDSFATAATLDRVGYGRGKATLAAPWWEDAGMTNGTVGLVLAAGAGSRFGGGKLLATIGGRPVLQHVLDAELSGSLREACVQGAENLHGERQ